MGSGGGEDSPLSDDGSIWVEFDPGGIGIEVWNRGKAFEYHGETYDSEQGDGEWACYTDVGRPGNGSCQTPFYCGVG